MLMEPIPVVRAAYLGLILEELEMSGRDSEADIHRFGLPSALPDKADAYLPLRQLLLFASWAANGAGLLDLGLRTASRVQFCDLDAGLRAAVAKAPTLDSALRAFTTMAQRELSPLRCQIIRGKEEVRICTTLDKSSHTPASPCGDWLGLMPVLAIIRHFAGRDWMPTAITLRSHTLPAHQDPQIFSDSRLTTGADETQIVLPAALLRLTALGRHRDAGGHREPGSRFGRPDRTDWNFPASLREVLRVYLGDGHPPVELAAEIAGTSVRSLQRRLRKFDLTYSDILAQVRFDAARHLLHDRNLKVIDAAYALGYSDPAHFARAFRRMAGVSPRRYRQERFAA